MALPVKKNGDGEYVVDEPKLVETGAARLNKLLFEKHEAINTVAGAKLRYFFFNMDPAFRETMENGNAMASGFKKIAAEKLPVPGYNPVLKTLADGGLLSAAELLWIDHCLRLQRFKTTTYGERFVEAGFKSGLPNKSIVPCLRMVFPEVIRKLVYSMDLDDAARNEFFRGFDVDGADLIEELTHMGSATCNWRDGVYRITTTTAVKLHKGLVAAAKATKSNISVANLDDLFPLSLDRRIKFARKEVRKKSYPLSAKQLKDAAIQNKRVTLTAEKRDKRRNPVLPRSEGNLLPPVS